MHRAFWQLACEFGGLAQASAAFDALDGSLAQAGNLRQLILRPLSRFAQAANIVGKLTSGSRRCLGARGKSFAWHLDSPSDKALNAQHWGSQRQEHDTNTT